jgi:hypothetical protein
VIDAQACLTDHRVGVIRAPVTEGSPVGLFDDICLLDHFHLRLPVQSRRKQTGKQHTFSGLRTVLLRVPCCHATLF